MIKHFSDEFWMYYAINMANRAEQEGEVPIGSVLVLNKKIIGKGWNSSIKYNDPTAHAEIIAIRNSGKSIGNYRILNSTIYSTLEPCIMCTGAIINARINRLVFGAYNNKYNLFKLQNYMLNYLKLNHKFSLTSGILEQKCSLQLKKFFKYKRKI